jgi:hypothetical protein
MTPLHAAWQHTRDTFVSETRLHAGEIELVHLGFIMGARAAVNHSLVSPLRTVLMSRELSDVEKELRGGDQ